MISFCKKIGIKPKENKISPVDIYIMFLTIKQMRVLYDQFKNVY